MLNESWANGMFVVPFSDWSSFVNCKPEPRPEPTHHHIARLMFQIGFNLTPTHCPGIAELSVGVGNKQKMNSCKYPSGNNLYRLL